MKYLPIGRQTDCGSSRRVVVVQNLRKCSELWWNPRECAKIGKKSENCEEIWGSNEEIVCPQSLVRRGGMWWLIACGRRWGKQPTKLAHQALASYLSAGLASRSCAADDIRLIRSKPRSNIGVRSSKQNISTTKSTDTKLCTKWAETLLERGIVIQNLGCRHSALGCGQPMWISARRSTQLTEMYSGECWPSAEYRRSSSAWYPACILVQKVL